MYIVAAMLSFSKRELSSPHCLVSQIAPHSKLCSNLSSPRFLADYLRIREIGNLNCSLLLFGIWAKWRQWHLESANFYGSVLSVTETGSIFTDCSSFYLVSVLWTFPLLHSVLPKYFGQGIVLIWLVEKEKREKQLRVILGWQDELALENYSPVSPHLSDLPLLNRDYRSGA